MGWCSGTDIFDSIILSAENNGINFESKAGKRFFQDTVEAFWNHDWDCEGDSNYFYLIQELFPEEFPE